MSKKKTAGRPPVLADNDVLCIDSRDATSKLQPASDRSAIIRRITELGGKASVQELNETFAFDVRAILLALIKTRWISIVKPAGK